MKKTIAMIFLVVSGIFLLSSCEITPDVVYNDGDSRKYISKLINIELPKGVIIEDEDTHGGFHGDGTYFAKVTFPEADIESFLNQVKSNFWQELPLSEDVDVIMYGGMIDDIDYGYYLAEKVNMPKVNNGYWYFNDRHADKKNDFHHRASYNFDLSIFDTDNKILYFYEYDS